MGSPKGTLLFLPSDTPSNYLAAGWAAASKSSGNPYFCSVKALCFETFGGPEVLQYRELPDPVLRAGEILVRTRAIGLNFADVYRRKGNYHLQGNPPYLAGYEGAGEVVQTTPGAPFAIGDRVAFADVPFANAELVAVPTERAIPLPETISFETAAALLLQGLTAHYLVHDSYPVGPGTTAVVHAAAGGVGQLLVQMIRLRGGKAIGLTSSPAKQAAAHAAGADATLLYTQPWIEAIRTYTQQRGADVVYDSVGATLPDSFAATRIGGTVVFYGMAGGDPAPVDPRMLMDTSKTLTGGDLWNYLTSREERIRRAQQLFDWVSRGELRLQPPAIFPLSEGAQAHRLLESRTSTGKIILVPEQTQGDLL